MAVSSRWSARVVGRWQLQPIWPSNRPPPLNTHTVIMDQVQRRYYRVLVNQ